MKKKSATQSAFFNLRVLIALVVVSAGLFLALLGFGAFSNALAGANQSPEQQKAEIAQKLGTQDNATRVIPAYHSDISRPLREIPTVWPPLAPGGEHEAALNPKLPHRHVDGPDPVHQSKFFQKYVAPHIPGPILNFDGIPFPGVSCNCAPPDTDGEVGKNHYVQMVNEGVQVFDKTTGASVLGPVSINSFWSGFGGACGSGSGDPVVVYDQLADRWVISQFAVGSGVPQDECIAVSTTGDPTGSYYRYGFHLSSNFLDYPKLGVWPDGYYMAANIFNTSGTAFLGPQAFVFDRSKMLVGDPAATSQTPGITGGASEETFLPGDLDGIIPPPTGAPNPYVAWPQGSPLIYKIWKYHVDFSTPANSTFTLFASVPAAPFTQLCPTTRACVPEPNGATLDAIADRLMFRNAYRNINGGTLVDNYTVSSNSVAGIRWIELRNVNSGPVAAPFQESTYQPDTTWRWMGSIAMDNQGDMALGFSASSSTVVPALRWAGRLVTDPVNTLAQGEATPFAGAGSQTGTSNRWGDYSDMTVDPVDDCTFWYTSEYYPTGSTSFNWRTRIANFKFPNCTAPAQGTAHFNVTFCQGGGALGGALITIDGNLYGSSLSTGFFDANLTPGNHTYSVSKPTFGTVTGNFTITSGQTTNVNVCLVGTPNIIAGGSSLVAENCSPPNMVIDPGETVTVTFNLTNNGGASTTNLVATLQNSGGVTPITTSQNYGAIAPGNTVGRDFIFIASGNCGGSITATLQLQDGANNLGTVTFTYTLGVLSVTLSENFDGVTPPILPSGWTADQGTNAGVPPFPMWVTSNSGTPTPVADSAPNSVYTVDPNNLLDNRLYTPSFMYSGAAQMTCRMNYDLEQQSASQAYDAGILQISINGGAYQDIIAAGGSFVTGGYNHTSLSTAFANPLLADACPGGACSNWSGVSAGFQTTTVNLPAAGAGQPVKLRWRMGSDNSVSHQGWRVDSVVVSGNYICCIGAPAVNSAVSRKTHGVAGTFDIALPLTGTTGVECRSGGATNDFTMVVTFAGNVTVTGSPQAQVISGMGCVGSGGTCNAAGPVTVAGNVVTIQLTNVTDQQTIQVRLNGVNSASNDEPAADVVIPMSRLLGDSNGNRSVNSGDILQVKQRVGQAVTSANFRSDLNANGSINAGDVSIAKQNTGHAVP